MSVRCGSMALRQRRWDVDRCVRSRNTFYMPARCASDTQFVLTRSRNTVSDVIGRSTAVSSEVPVGRALGRLRAKCFRPTPNSLSTQQD